MMSNSVFIFYFFLTLFIIIFFLIIFRIRGDFKRSSSISNYLLVQKKYIIYLLPFSFVMSYISASSYLSGPGYVFKTGVSWIIISFLQIPFVFLWEYFIFKKLSKYIKKSKTEILSFLDFLKPDKLSSFLICFVYFIILIFSIGIIYVQILGGSILLKYFWGIPPFVSFFIAFVLLILYLPLGGMKQVVITDTIQGIIFLITISVTIILLCIKNPNWYTTALDFSPQFFNIQISINQWISYIMLLTIGILGLPQFTLQGILRTQNEHQKRFKGYLFVSSILLIILIIGCHLPGLLAHNFIDPNSVQNSDYFIPILYQRLFPKFALGIFSITILSAILSSVDTIIMMNIGNTYSLISHFYPEDGKTLFERFLYPLTTSICILTYLGTFILNSAIMLQINLFALGGLESLCFPVTIFILYFKDAQKHCIEFSLLSGGISYILLSFIVGAWVYDLNIVIFGILFGFLGGLIGYHFDKSKNLLS